MSVYPPVRPYVARAESAAPSNAGGKFTLLPPYVHGRASSIPIVEELPSIDEFLDRTPPIEQFAPAPPPPAQPVESAAESWPSWGGEASAYTPPPAPPADWEEYDWGSAGRLGAAPPDAAAEAWASTDWSEPSGAKESRQSAAEALARALDQIARRIRTGELHVPGPDTFRDDAAIAGTLAALLGIRR